MITLCIAAEGDGEITSVRVASGLNRPIYVTAAPGDSDRLFILEQYGDIKILDLNTGQLNPTPFLSVPGLVTAPRYGQRGMAFHPQFATNGYFYVNEMVNSPIRNVVRRYQVSSTNPDVADPASGYALMSYDATSVWHHGNWIGFGPDGYLYHSIGDGGQLNDPGNNAQNLDQIRGKILRIDVGIDGQADDFPTDPERNYAIPPSNPFVSSAGLDEIWAYGLRQPWRASFDRASGDFYVADVGLVKREEINFQPSSSQGGQNYGWRVMEGTSCHDNSQTNGNPACNDPRFTSPMYEYDRAGIAASITGGYVYRGPIPAIQGEYFFADYEYDGIWSIRHDGTTVTQLTDWTSQLTPDIGSLDSIASFGEDVSGNLYLVDIDEGEIFRIESVPDCDFDDDEFCNLADLNGLLSEGPIAPGVTVVPGVNDQFDITNDGVLDLDDLDTWLANAAAFNGFGSPYKRGDTNLSGAVDGSDFNLWNANKFTSNLHWDRGDVNGDGSVDGSDFNLWNLNRFTTSDFGSIVPEPTGVALMLLGCMTSPWLRKQRWTAHSRRKTTTTTGESLVSTP